MNTSRHYALVTIMHGSQGQYRCNRFDSTVSVPIADRDLNARPDITGIEIEWAGEKVRLVAPLKPKVRVHPQRPNRVFRSQHDDSYGEFDLYERMDVGYPEQRGRGGRKNNDPTYFEVYPATYAPSDSPGRHCC